LLFPNIRCGPQPPYPLSSRPERSAVERSAVAFSLTSAAGYDRATLCHLDRSEAQWRDLRLPIPKIRCGPQPPYPLSSRPERSAVERSAVASSWRNSLKRQLSFLGVELLGIKIGDLLQIVDRLKIPVLFPILNSRICLCRSKSQTAHKLSRCRLINIHWGA